MQELKKQHSSPFRIGLLITSVEFGGLDKVVIGLLDNIDRENFAAIPIIFSTTGRNGNTVPVHLDKLGLEYRKISVNNYRIKYLNPVANIMQTYSTFRSCQFDLIHTHGYRADVLGYIAAKTLGLPIIATCHGFISNDRKLLVYNKMDRFILKFFNRIIAVSKEIEMGLRDGGVEGNKISIIPNAIDISYDEMNFDKVRCARRNLMGFTDHHLVLGYVGRLSEEKGLKYLIEGVLDLLAKNLPIKLVLIGEGPQRQQLESLTKEKGIGNSVCFLGFQQDVESWLPMMDIFVLPSLTEGTPLALLEAMSCGIPVVASSVGGVPDIIKSGTNGILVRPGNSQEIRNAIGLLSMDKNIRLKMGKEGKATMQAEYNMQSWIRNIEAEYLKVLEG